MPMTVGISKRPNQMTNVPCSYEQCVLVCITSALSGNGTAEKGALAQTEMTAAEARSYAEMLMSAADSIDRPFVEGPKSRYGAVPL